MNKVGFIGLGTMGAPMAMNLLNAGHELYFYTRREPVVKQFRDAGAISVGNCAEVAEAAEVIITIVPADREVEQVLVSDTGVIAGGGPGKLVVDMSTISPSTVRRVATRLETVGMSMLDAPVSGGPSGAKAGKLSIMAGGSEDDFMRVFSIFKVLGEKIFHLGPLGAGQTTKLVNQLLSGSIMTLIGEAMSVAKAAGLDLSQVVDLISASSGNSTMLAARAKFLLDDDFEPGFKTELMRKDMVLGLALAQEHNTPAPVAAAALQKYTAAISRGDRTLDFSVVARLT